MILVARPFSSQISWPKVNYSFLPIYGFVAFATTFRFSRTLEPLSSEPPARDGVFNVTLNLHCSVQDCNVRLTRELPQAGVLQAHGAMGRFRW